MKLMKHKWVFFVISALIIVPGLISLILFGFKVAIDFTGGSLLEVQLIDEPSPSDFNLDMLGQLAGETVQIDSLQLADNATFIIRGQTMSNQDKEQLVAVLTDHYGQLQVLRFESVGPLLGAELLKKTITAVILVAGVITIYIWRQFKDFKYGICAVLAMLHDSLVLLGSFSLLGYFSGIEVDVLFVTAVLTTLSFSIHDTIVVYDRIRELKRKNPQLDLETVANVAVSETLSRSLNNSLTIILMLAALFFLGGESIRNFVLALLIGAVTGTYSSTFTAVPLLLVWEQRAKKKPRSEK